MPLKRMVSGTQAPVLPGTCALVHASILARFDSYRLKKRLFRAVAPEVMFAVSCIRWLKNQMSAGTQSWLSRLKEYRSATPAWVPGTLPVPRVESGLLVQVERSQVLDVLAGAVRGGELHQVGTGPEVVPPGQMRRLESRRRSGR